MCHYQFSHVCWIRINWWITSRENLKTVKSIFFISRIECFICSFRLHGFWREILSHCSTGNMLFFSHCFQDVFYFILFYFSIRSGLIVVHINRFLWIYPVSCSLSFLNRDLLLEMCFGHYFLKDFLVLHFLFFFCNSDHTGVLYIVL